MNAQEEHLPFADEVVLIAEEDYINFQDEVLLYIDWLENNPLKRKHRKEMNAVFLKWIIGTPSLDIVLHGYEMEYTKKNEGLLTIFMTGYSKYVIENPQEKSNQLAGHLAGINALLDYYSKGKKMKVRKDKKVEKLLKIREIGQLEEYISRQLK